MNFTETVGCIVVGIACIWLILAICGAIISLGLCVPAVLVVIGVLTFVVEDMK